MRKERGVLVMAGIGNNGGDGLALARLLSEKGYDVEVVCCGEEEKASAQWKAQRRILGNYPVKIGRKPEHREYNILIDALFGVGLTRPVEGAYAELIGWFNGCTGYKVAMDIPSGIHSDTGDIMGCAVKAERTVTFGFAKRGLFFPPGSECAGEVKVKDIGIGAVSFADGAPGMFRFTQPPETLFPSRDRWGNKGSFGKVLLVAGSRNMAGAALLAGRSIFRSGAGMVKIITDRANRTILQGGLPEAMVGEESELEEGLKWGSVVAVGPGIGRGPGAARMLRTVLAKSNLPLVIDADGLNIMSGDFKLRDMVQAQGAGGRQIVLTPHMGELSRLMGVEMERLKKDRVESISRLARELHCVVVGKDARTYVCGEGKEVCLSVVGNSGMATAGSGDVLTGVIAGLLAQGMDAYQAACAGVYIHGTAGDAAAASRGEQGVMAGDIVDNIGR
jgi:NAD(P)H-hydrate epimerase